MLKLKLKLRLKPTTRNRLSTHNRPHNRLSTRKMQLSLPSSWPTNNKLSLQTLNRNGLMPKPWGNPWGNSLWSTRASSPCTAKPT